MRMRSVWRCAPTALGCCVLVHLMVFSRPLPAGTVWNYDFGSGTGSFTADVSESFLPATAADGGTARVRIGGGGGEFALVNSGSGPSSLVGTASTSTSVNKFSIYDFAGTGLFTLNAELTFHGGDSGSWYLLVGNGGRFSDNNSYSKEEVFAGLRWDFGTAGSLATTRLSSSGSWLTTGVPTMAQDTTYRLKIHANNTAVAVDHAGQTVAPGSWDLLVDGVLIASGLAKAGLPDGIAIDSFMFNGSSSAGNGAALTVSSVGYANVLAPEPEAWVLLTIAAGCCAAASWKRSRSRRWPSA